MLFWITAVQHEELLAEIAYRNPRTHKSGRLVCFFFSEEGLLMHVVNQEVTWQWHPALVTLFSYWSESRTCSIRVSSLGLHWLAIYDYVHYHSLDVIWFLLGSAGGTYSLREITGTRASYELKQGKSRWPQSQSWTKIQFCDIVLTLCFYIKPKQLTPHRLA